MAVASKSEDWKRIAEAITIEPNNSKLVELVKQLCAALDGVKTEDGGKEDIQGDASGWRSSLSG